jgi:hypothetical protein
MRDMVGRRVISHLTNLTFVLQFGTIGKHSNDYVAAWSNVATT